MATGNSVTFYAMGAGSEATANNLAAQIDGETDLLWNSPEDIKSEVGHLKQWHGGKIFKITIEEIETLTVLDA